jgi:DNA anti-recombination protein RmuC
LNASLSRLIAHLSKLPSSAAFQAIDQKLACLHRDLAAVNGLLGKMDELKDSVSTKLDAFGAALSDAGGQAGAKIQELEGKMAKNADAAREKAAEAVEKFEAAENDGTIANGLWEILWPQGDGRLPRVDEVDGLNELGRPSAGFCSVM